MYHTHLRPQGVDLVLEKGMPLMSVAREVRRALGAKRLERGIALTPTDLPPGQPPAPGSALASDSVELLHSSYPMGTGSDTPLLNLEHLHGFRPEIVHRICVAAFSADSAESLAGTLRKLEATYNEKGQPTEMITEGALFKHTHKLVGDAASCGATELTRQAREFEVAPSPDAFRVLWSTLDSTRAELIAKGLLQRPAAAQV